MDMKRLLLTMAAGLMALPAFNQIKEARTVEHFTGIQASHVFHITVTKGIVESVVIEADEAIMHYVRCEVRNGVLHLYLEREATRWPKSIKILKAHIVMNELERVSLTGACTLESRELFTPATFTANCSGASNMTIQVQCNDLNVRANGVGKIELKARVNGNAELDVSGVAKMAVELHGTYVKLSSGGVSSVDLTGSATDLQINISGTSRVGAGDFDSKNAVLNLYGTSTVTIGTTEVLKVNSSGASFVNYKGSPTIQLFNGGISKVKKI